MKDKTIFYNSKGDILARDNFVIAFFSKCPFVDMVEGARNAYNVWLAHIPESSLCYALIGTNSSKYIKVNSKTLARCKEMLESEASKKKNIYFEILGPQGYGPDYRAIVKGFVKPKKLAFADETNLIEFTFPIEYIQECGSERILELVKLLCDTLPYDSGYASPALYYGLRGQYAAAAEFISPLAFRHHGYDVPNNPGTTVWLGRNCRGARWLTMLSYSLMDQVGGVVKLKQDLPKEVEFLDSTNGIIIRAGREPEIGDVNRKLFTPLVSLVAQKIKKITYFNDNSLLPIFGNVEDKRNRWEQRFWWNEN